MPLDDCIAKIKTLSDQDAEFLRQAVADGATEADALDMLGATIEDAVNEITGLVEQAGGKVRMEGERLFPVTETLSQEDQEIEQQFWEQLQNFNKEIKNYGKLKDAQGGKVLNTDVARELSQSYLDDRTKSAAVHEPASQFIKDLYAKKLKQRPGKGEVDMVLFTAGGTGAGKTSAVDQVLGTIVDEAQIIYDTNLNKYDSGVSKVRQALEAGKDVTITLVDRDPVDALVNGALPRAERQKEEFGTGRTVPLIEHLKTHTGAAATVRRIAEEFKDDDRVVVQVINNNLGRGNAAPMSLEELGQIDYTGLEDQLDAALEAEYAAKNISEETYRGFKGEEVDAAPGAVAQDAGLDDQQAQREGPESLAQPGDQDRGRFFPDVNGKRVIQLTEAADLSSFLHESGHMFLDIQRLWAEKYGMNENQQAMLDWLEADNFEGLTPAQHELWAETFEVYLREGKAPSIGLRRAFASFTSWLKRIYRTLQDPRLTNARLNPEIREVFDRMLATEAEIDLAAMQPEYAELFQSQEQAGMTDAQWAKYKQNATRKNEIAEATIDAKVMKQYKKMKSDEWRREKAPLIEQEAERIGREPIYQLMSDMTEIKDENGETVSDGRVNWHTLRDEIGEWPNGKNWIGKAVGGGVDPGLYAEAYGFASVRDMYDQVRNSDTLKQAADKAAESLLVAKYGDILNDGSLEQEVREAMLNEEQAAMVLAELKAEGRPEAQLINRGQLKHQAEKLIGTFTYKQIRPSKFYNQMVKSAQAAGKAADPTNDKIQQLANHYLYRAANDAKQQMDRGRKKVRGVQNREYKPTQVDAQYIEAMKNLANAYDMRLNPVERDAFARRVLDFYEGQTNPNNENSELFGLEMLDPNLVAAIRYRHDNGTLEGFQLTTFDEMTVSEMKGVTDMIDHLRYVGGQVANKGSAEMAAIREAGLESIEENGGRDSRVQRGKTRKGKMAKLTWGDMVNSIPSLGNMIRKLDGFNEGGWGFEHILKPINDAVSRKFELQKELFLEMEGFMSNMSRVGLRENDAMPFTKEDGTEDDFTSSEVFMMAVYWGTSSSRQALMDGHGMTQNDVEQLMTRLTPDQLTLVNNVWAMNEAQWPQLQEAAKAMLGVAPPKLEATPFIVNGVEMTGGHMQLMYDSQALELADEQMRGMNTANVVPMQAGSTHSRVGSGGRPVLLDTRNITQSVEEKTHYIAFAQVGRHLRGILNNKEIQNKIEKKHGAPFYENMLHAITSISRAEPARETSRWLARLSRHMRGSATMMHLAYSIRNVAQQFSAIPIAAREVGVLKWTTSMAHFGSRPMQVKAMVDGKSKFMENRAQVVNREAKEYMRKVMATSRGEAMWQSVKARGFILQTLVDSTVAYPTWMARYETGMEKHGDEKRAVIEADQSVAESVGSGADMHLGRIMQSNQNEFVKTLTVFGSWFNAYYQRLYKSSKGGTDFLSGAFLMDGILMPIIVANFAQILIMDTPDDDEEIPEYVAKNTFKFMLGTMPLVRDIASAWEGFAPTMPISAVATAPVRMKQEIESFMKGNQSGLKLTADIGRTVGSVAPLPGSGNLWRFLDYVDSYLEGKEGKNFNLYQALAEGRDKDK